MMENADEYFAEASQAWFGATVRTDVNSGAHTRRLLQERDPGLAELLLQVRVPCSFGPERLHNKRAMWAVHAIQQVPPRGPPAPS